MEKVKVGKYTTDQEEWNYISDEAKNLLKKMLEKDPKKRYSAEDCLNDAWIKKFSEDQVVEQPLFMKSLNNLRTFRVIYYLFNFLLKKIIFI